MTQHRGHRHILKNLLKNLLRDERGAILVMFTVYMPVIVGMFSLAVDYSYVLRTRNVIQVTADAAALAAAAYLPDAGATCTVAQLYANTNMSISSYGNVLSNCSDVVVGMWACAAGQTCAPANFVPDATTACGIQCNAVQVTTRMTAANGNALALAFGSMVGISAFDVTAKSIAVYGNDPGAVPWSISIVQDVSGSFTQEISKAKDADQALETCMLNNSPGSKLGITVFGETSKNYQPPLAVSSNDSQLTSAISNINTSGNNPMPQSGGTDIAAGINTAIGQICPGTTCTPPPTTFRPALVIVTDGLPNTCGGQSCSVSTAKANADAAAQAASDKGMDVYAIYFCNDGTGTCNSQTNQDAATWLAGLVKRNGKFSMTPTADDMKKLMVTGVCKPQHTFRLVW